LIVCFSLGLATVLIAIGVAMVRARTLLSSWRSDSPWIQRYIPMASATAMLIAGIAIAATALPATGISLHWGSLTDGHAGSFVAIVALGLVLGMRHSTDPDHVVAVSTIVSRERSVKQGAVIGMMWGFGHTITIFIVGAAIILFNLTIPPRIGLSMEMAVAAMLILLGVLNLTGVLRKLTDRFTPQSKPDGLMDNRAQPTGFFGRLLARFGYYQLLRPLAIGLVHGLAGSAAVALLVLSMIHSCLGHRLPCYLRSRNGRGHDADDHGHGDSCSAYWPAFDTLPYDRLWPGKCLLWPLPRLSPWLRGWPVHQPRPLDAGVKPVQRSRRAGLYRAEGEPWSLRP
jgi:ABC-type nickel/cobalt efflux system permease component RcnA